MKQFFSRAALVVVVALASVGSVVNAQTPSQTPSVEYGRTTMQFSSDFINSLQGLGVVITDLHGNPLQNNSLTIRAVAGAIDLATSAGEVEHTGGLLLNAGGTLIRIQNLTIDTSNVSWPVVTAEFILNDHFMLRMPLFSIQPPASFSLPLQPQSGALQQNGLILTLAPATASALNNLFGGPVLQAGANAGTANTYVMFSSSN